MSSTLTGGKQACALSWRALLLLAALADVVVLLYLTIAGRDLLALALAAAILIGLALLRFRGGQIGLLVLGLVFADTAFWTLPGAVANFANRETLATLLLPSLLGILSLAGLAAVVAVYLRRGAAGSPSTAALRLGLLTLALLALAGVGAVAAQFGAIAALPVADVAIETRNMAFIPETLQAPRQLVVVRLANQDLWWHTFTIDALGVNQSVAMGAEHRFSFSAPPGEYEFYCAIPGHAAIGMRGTLTVAGQ